MAIDVKQKRDSRLHMGQISAGSQNHGRPFPALQEQVWHLKMSCALPVGRTQNDRIPCGINILESRSPSAQEALFFLEHLQVLGDFLGRLQSPGPPTKAPGPRIPTFDCFRPPERIFVWEMRGLVTWRGSDGRREGAKNSLGPARPPIFLLLFPLLVNL